MKNKPLTNFLRKSIRDYISWFKYEDDNIDLANKLLKGDILVYLAFKKQYEKN